MSKLLVLLAGLIISGCATDDTIFILDSKCKRIGLELGISVGFELVNKGLTQEYTCLLNHPKYQRVLHIYSDQLDSVLRGILLEKELHKR